MAAVIAMLFSSWRKQFRRAHFEGIADALTGDAVHLSMTVGRGRRVALQFPNNCRERLNTLRNGQKITALCQIRHGYGDFTLENCELTQVEPLRLTLARAS